MNTSATFAQDRTDVLRYIYSIKSPGTMHRVKEALSEVFISIKPKKATAATDTRAETRSFLENIQSLWSDSPSAEELVEDIYNHRADSADSYHDYVL